MLTKPGTIFTILLCLFFNFLSAQSGNIGQYNKAVTEMVNADKLYQDTKNAKDVPTVKKYAEAYKKAGDDFATAKASLPGLDIKTTYYASYCYYSASQGYYLISDLSNGNDLIFSALQQWPQFKDVPYKKLVGETKIKDGGQTYSIQAAVKEDDLYKIYYSIQENAARLFYEKKSYEDAIQHADTVLHQNYRFPLISVQVADYAAKSAHLLQKDEKSTEYTITGLQKAGEFQAVNDKEKVEYRAIVNSLINNLETFGGYDAVFAANAAIALSKVSKYDINIWDKAKRIGYGAYDKGQNSKQLLFALADIERGEAEDKEVKKWVDILETRRSEFDKADFNHLAIEYNYLKDGKDAARSIRHGKHYESRKSTFVAVATNPFNYFIWHQYPFSLDLVRPNTAHEIRVCIDNNTPYVIIHQAIDTSKQLLYLHYTGYEISYTLKHRFPSLSGKKWLCPYAGVQFRYTYRKFDPDSVEISDTNSKPHNVWVNSTSQEFTFNLQFGEQIRYKRFFADFFTGVGVGYRTMVATPNIFVSPANDPTNIDDERYGISRWNSVYLPLRLGFRIGIVL